LRHTFIFAADDAVLKHTGKFEGEIIFWLISRFLELRIKSLSFSLRQSTRVSNHPR
jgi:hypothetical protein